MAKFNFKLYGKDYTVNCGPGEEERLRDIIDFVAAKMQNVTDRVGNTTEPRLLMLTCLQIADELIEARTRAAEGNREEEELILAAVEHLKGRVVNIANQIGRA